MYLKTGICSNIVHIRLLKPYQDKVLTLTFDNGTEFVEHEKVGRILEAETYFAHPYASWERPINENTNGLIRQFFPKKTDFKKSDLASSKSGYRKFK
ncbi:IS30 family transposase [Aliikangiella maris]|uniref:IS30 family transposase n=2 Tax=Aliikangiella maris TaxID=3162458 RepID=A0ABV2BU63_9GAMM